MNNLRVVTCVIAAAAAVAFRGQNADGQTVIFACYVPTTGIVYRVGGPDECRGNHVEFRWTELPVVDGKVGIGVPNPVAALDVAGDMRASGVLTLGNTLAFDGATNAITTGTDEDLLLMPGGGGTGSVGINTMHPAAKLSVAGDVMIDGPVRLAGNWARIVAEKDASDVSNIQFLTSAGPGPQERVRIDGSGNVGIGVTNPFVKLQVAGNADNPVVNHLQSVHPQGTLTHFANSTTATEWNVGVGGSSGWSPQGSFVIDEHTKGQRLVITPGGNVGVGTITPSDRLEVAGSIRVTGGDFIADGTTLSVPDFVFGEDYVSLPLDDLQSYIDRERHLPNVPNHNDIAEHGLNIGQFQMRLLEKIEELTLYVLAQHREIEALRLQVSRFGTENRHDG